MKWFPARLVSLLLLASAAGDAQAYVNIETVPVGNPGNAGEVSGAGAGGNGPDRICGAVDYTYNIGKYEVTAGQYCEFLNAVADIDTHGLYNTSMWSNTYGCKIERYTGSGTPSEPYQYRVAVDHANRPVIYVSWYDAARFCNWMTTGDTESGVYNTSHAHWGEGWATTDDYIMDHQTAAATYGTPYFIPTENEWYKAAYHKNDGVTGNYFDYPTGSNTAPITEPPPGTNNENGSANCGWVAGGLTDVGAYTAKPSDSPYGTYDQGGNVWEWNEANFSAVTRGVRGACFANGVSCLHASERSVQYSPTAEGAIGFRVASIPEPGSVALLCMAALGLFAYAWRRRKGRARILCSR